MAPHGGTSGLPDDILCMRCSAHHFAYNGSMYAVNERFQRVGGQGSDPQTARWLAAHHYITRSKQVPDACMPGVLMYLKDC